MHRGNERRRLRRVRAEPLEIESVGEELGIADQHYARACRVSVQCPRGLGLDLSGYRYISSVSVCGEIPGIATSSRDQSQGSELNIQVPPRLGWGQFIEHAGYFSYRSEARVQLGDQRRVEHVFAAVQVNQPRGGRDTLVPDADARG